MASRVQKRRGSPSDHASFTTGAAGEVTVELPTTRGSGATQAYGALYVHHGDGAVGDRIAGVTELTNTIKSTVDEQRFLAKIVGFRPIDDDNLVVNPDILPSRWEYKWEEVSISGGSADTLHVAKFVIADATVTGAQSGAEVTVPTNVYGTNVTIATAISGSTAGADVATVIRNAVNANGSTIYTASGTGREVIFTADAGNTGRLQTPTHNITVIGVTTSTTTVGNKYTVITGSSDNLGRKSDPGNDNTHEFAAINIAELNNGPSFVGPGIGNGSADITIQSDSNGPWPTNYKVVPIGGSPDYTSGEPDTTANDSDAAFFRATAVPYVVEMTERRKLNPGTGSGQTVGTANSDGFNVFYYFNVPNAITGPC